MTSTRKKQGKTYHNGRQSNSQLDFSRKTKDKRQRQPKRKASQGWGDKLMRAIQRSERKQGSRHTKGTDVGE